MRWPLEPGALPLAECPVPGIAAFGSLVHPYAVGRYGPRAPR